MPTPQVYNDFTGGWNNASTPDNMKDNELRLADNLIISNRGGAKKRPGCTKLNSTSYSAEVNQEIEWPLSDGNVKNVAVVSGDLCLMNDYTGAKTVKLASLNDTIIGYAIYKDKLFFVDGLKYYVWGYYKYSTASGTVTIALNDIVKNTPVSSGGGTVDHFYKALAAHGSTNLATEDYSNAARWTDVTDGIIPDDIREVPADPGANNDLEPIKRCKLLLWHPASYRFFAAGDPQDSTALYYSEIDNPYYFKSATSKMYPNTALGKAISIINMVKSVLIGYQSGWMYWTGSDVSTAEWKRLPIPVGVACHHSIALTPYSCTFYAKEGICTFAAAILNLDSAVMVVDTSLFSILTDDRLEDIIAEVQYPLNTRACYYKGKYYFAYSDLSSSTANNRVLVCDFTMKSKPFTRYTGWQVNYFCPKQSGILHIATKNYILKYGVDATNDINVDTGAAKAIKMDLKTKPYCLGGINYSFNNKTVTRLFIQAQQESEILSVVSSIKLISGYVSTDFNMTNLVVSDSFVWGDPWGKLWGTSEFSTFEGVPNLLGYRHQVEIIDETLSNELFIYSIGFEFIINSAIGSLISPALINDNNYQGGV